MSNSKKTDPHVGVFYFLDGKVHARSRPLSALTDQCSGTGGGIVSFSTHFSFWSTLRESDPERMNKDDSFHPRGRVLYKPQEDLFIIRMDACIPLWALPTILSTFNLSNLPPEKIHLVHGRDPPSGDHHYQCHQCGPLTRRRVL